MFKKFLRLIFLFIIAVVVLYIIFWLFVVFLIGQTWKVRNGEKFCINKQYAIWNAYNDNTIDFCDNTKKGKCISLINSYVVWDNKDLYLYFNLNDFTRLTEEEINKYISNWYLYYIFQNDYDNKYFAKSYNDLKRYLKLDYNTCKIEFYSNNDIEKLNDIEKNIFKGLINK